MADWRVVAATGHRPEKLPKGSADWVRSELTRVATKLRDHHGMQVGISGMARGTDLWWAGAIDLLDDVELWAYVPFPQQSDTWSAADRAEWRRLYSAAATERMFGDGYATRLFFERNAGMVEDSNAVVAVWVPGTTGDGTVNRRYYRSGTADAVQRARRMGRPVVHINPATRTTGLIEPATRQLRTPGPGLA